jgi:hypothetical protein
MLGDAMSSGLSISSGLFHQRKYTMIVQIACAKVFSSSKLSGSRCATLTKQEIQNQVACKQAIDFVSQSPLLLSLTSPSATSGRSSGAVFTRNSTPFSVSLRGTSDGMKGSGPPPSAPMPPMTAQKLCVMVHLCFKLGNCASLSSSRGISHSLPRLNMQLTVSFALVTNTSCTCFCTLLAAVRCVQATEIMTSGAKRLQMIHPARRSRTSRQLSGLAGKLRWTALQTPSNNVIVHVDRMLKDPLRSESDCHVIVLLLVAWLKRCAMSAMILT